MSARELDWQAGAACTNEPTDAFFPPRLPVKHQAQRDKVNAQRLARKRRLAPQDLTIAEWAALDQLHQEQRDPYTHARVICGGCAVRQECLAYALANEPDEGMWGGLDERERRRLRKRLQRAAATVARSNGAAVRVDLAS